MYVQSYETTDGTHSKYFLICFIFETGYLNLGKDKCDMTKNMQKIVTTEETMKYSSGKLGRFVLAKQIVQAGVFTQLFIILHKN